MTTRQRFRVYVLLQSSFEASEYAISQSAAAVSFALPELGAHLLVIHNSTSRGTSCVLVTAGTWHSWRMITHARVPLLTCYRLLVLIMTGEFPRGPHIYFLPSTVHPLFIFVCDSRTSHLLSMHTRRLRVGSQLISNQSLCSCSRKQLPMGYLATRDDAHTAFPPPTCMMQ